MAHDRSSSSNLMLVPGDVDADEVPEDVFSSVALFEWRVDDVERLCVEREGFSLGGDGQAEDTPEDVVESGDTPRAAVRASELLR